MHTIKKLTSLIGMVLLPLSCAVQATPAPVPAAAAPIVPAVVVRAPASSLVQRGEYLARAGDCIACHSAPGKPAFAGGLPIDSGHGIIYSTNITPDKQHGIGSYTEQQFADAVRKGVRADGTHLYPAMPYTSYAKVNDDDIKALYAFFMQGVKPSDAVPPASAMSFPFNQRWGMTFWNFFFASDKPFKAQPGWSGEITRGAYLVEGLGHCSSCHTPRGFALNEEASDSAQLKFLSGGDLNGWPVPSLRGMPKWSEANIVDYLQTGRNHGAAVAGEMTSVVEHSTSHLKDADLKSIAVYLKSLSPVAHPKPSVTPQGADATIKKLTAATGLNLGERLYLDNCSACHFVTGKGAARVFPALDGNGVANHGNPNALIQVILHGARTPSTEKAPSILVMPGFSKRLSDSEVATLATFVRQGWSNHGGAVSESDVAKVRAQAK